MTTTQDDLDTPVRPTNTNTERERSTFALLAMCIGTDAFAFQEKQGQVEAVSSATLPVPRDLETRKEYEALGIVFGQPFPDDKLFCFAQMPAGWSKRSAGHSMHNEIVDAFGRRRGSFYYKASFYDRDAILYHAVRRYNAEEHSLDADDTYDRCNLQRYHVLDRVLAVPIEEELNAALEEQYAARNKAQAAARVAEITARLAATALFTVSYTVDLPRPKDRPETDDDSLAHRAWWDRRDALRKQAMGECNAWLDANLPDHRSPAAYWPI